MGLATMAMVLMLPSVLRAQDTARIEVLNADEWRFDEAIAPGAQRLRGNVRFRHAGATMTCDSAWLFEDQRVRAYSNIRITQGDTLTLAGNLLDYEGSRRVATVDGGVRLTDPGSTLAAPTLIYDLRGRAATYVGGGVLVSRAQGDTLTSRRGTYLADARRFIFSGDVRLRHPDRRIEADTLHYLTGTSTAEFHGPTVITQSDSRITCVSGTYDTRSRQASFSKGARLVSKGQDLQGDSIHYDGERGIGRAWGSVAATDTANGTTVLGDVGRHDQAGGHSFVTGNARLLLRSGTDTLFLHADTLFAAPGDGPEERRITAHRGVRLYEKDLQGVCDTLVYSTADSLIRMYHRPVLWNGSNQVTGRHIRIQLSGGRVDRLFAEGGAFMASRVDSGRFDQVSGRTMTGLFMDNALDRLLTEGNSRTVYHAVEQRDSVRTIVGVNRADCANMLVRVRNGEVASVTFLTQPDAVLYPVEQLPAEERLLPGFEWREEERPRDRADVFRDTPPAAP